MLEDKVRQAVEEVLPLHYEDGKPVMRVKPAKEAVEEAVAKIMKAIHKAYDKYSERVEGV